MNGFATFPKIFSIAVRSPFNVLIHNIIHYCFEEIQFQDNVMNKSVLLFSSYSEICILYYREQGE
jgi:hypothetical protein